ncbi:MAG: 2'-5' RNA ligase family protein [Bacteroidota bacterium]
MPTIRQQLTLFVPESQSAEIEKVRKQFNPIQYGLIAAHVTLCREDEIVDLDVVMDNINRIETKELSVSLGQATRFSEGKGVTLDGHGSNVAFHALRKEVLKGIIGQPRQHQPHITLMHPRNATCTDQMFEEIRQFKLPEVITFDKISLIEQRDWGKWTTLKAFAISKRL